MRKRKLYGIRSCFICGKEVEIYHKQRLEKERVFCSNECVAIANKKPCNAKCAICGKPILKKLSDLKKAKHPPCCSTKCGGELKKIIYRGEHNPNYGLRGKKSKLFVGVERYHCGYIWVYMPEHPFAVKDAGMRIRKHRIVAEQYLLTDENSVEINGKRYLNPKYDVHHKDGNKLNNNPDNLEILTRSQHAKLHAKTRL